MVHRIWIKIGLFIFFFGTQTAAQSSSTTDRPEESVSSELEPPENYHNQACGRTERLPDLVWVIGDDDNSHSVYYLNATADELRKEGFNVTVTEMGGRPISDQIKAMTYTNESFTGSSYFKEFRFKRRLITGGEKAERVRAEAMALIGDQREDKIIWFCNGVLINNFWVLSAAHCLLDSNVQANIIRLGEYDRSTDFDFGERQVPYYSSTLDSEIEKIVPYPDFILTERYHDIVLFKLKKPAPLWSLRIQPICLPWGDYNVKEDLVGQNLTLTGWGATSFGNQDVTQVLQQVNVEVFKTEKCHRSYNLLRTFQTKYPRGMSADDILCAGSNFEGKDACKGDSGGPMVYDNNHFHKFTVVGIVSGGHGCGDKDFPGLYIPIYKPKYLQWIKDVAFLNVDHRPREKKKTKKIDSPKEVEIASQPKLQTSQIRYSNFPEETFNREILFPTVDDY